jgi:hypothetical protein
MKTAKRPMLTGEAPRVRIDRLDVSYFDAAEKSGLAISTPRSVGPTVARRVTLKCLSDL